MHKTHIFDQKNYAKKKRRFYRPTYPIFFRTVTGNKQLFFLGLNRDMISLLRPRKKSHISYLLKLAGQYGTQGSTLILRAQVIIFRIFKSTSRIYPGDQNSTDYSNDLGSSVRFFLKYFIKKYIYLYGFIMPINDVPVFKICILRGYP